MWAIAQSAIRSLFRNTTLDKIHACHWASDVINMKAMTTLSPSVVIAGRLTLLLQIPKMSFLDSLELTRRRYCFEVLGYVVMPEHVHILVSEPADHHVPLSKALQALKISVAMRLHARPFWQRRYYDFNVFTHNKRVEKLKYMQQ